MAEMILGAVIMLVGIVVGAGVANIKQKEN